MNGAPLIKDILIALVAATILILMATAAIILRLLRKKVAPEDRASVDAPEFPLHAYHGLIRQFKEQESELKRLRRNESERAAASENISDAVLTNLSSGVLLFSPGGTVRQANSAAREILGYASPFGLHGRDLFRGASSVRKEDGETRGTEGLTEALAEALEQGRAIRRMEVDYVTPGGEKRLLGITVSPVRGAGGEALGAACLISDLTEIASLSRQMRLRENLAALGEMSAGIAHEFKNSLATISGYAQMLAGENDPAVRRFGEKIVAETANLTRIVTDFLKFARPLELSREPVEMRGMLADCARECGIDLEVLDFPSEVTVMGDPTALRQAVLNLLRNSAEAAREGVPARVQASAETVESETRIVLRDNGCGIPPQHLSRIFIPFFTTKAEGTGLGLALVHRILAEHGGSVAVRSDSSGTAFTLSFPMEAPARMVSTPT